MRKSDTLIRRWKERWEWEERVRAYDNELEKEAWAEVAKDRKDMTERHIEMAMQVQEKALEALTNLEAADMSPKDIKEFLKMATDLEKLNRTFEENSKEKGGTQVLLADTVIAAYQKRKE